MIARLSPGAAAALLLVLLLLAPPLSRAQTPSWCAEGSAGAPGATLERVEENVIARRVREATAERLVERPRELRDLWEAAADALRAEVPPAGRPVALDALEERIARSLAGAAGGDGDASDAVAGARALSRERRIVHFYESFKCNCESENWTRTLAGCFEPCADDQKNLVVEWIDAGYGDEEIRERMVAAAGSDKVIVESRPFVSVVVPYAIFVAVGVLGAWILVRLRRRGAPAGRTGADSGSGEASGAEDSERDEPREAELDPAWERRLERELRALDE